MRVGSCRCGRTCFHLSELGLVTADLISSELGLVTADLILSELGRVTALQT